MDDLVPAWAGLILVWVECLVFWFVCRAQARPGATRNAWSGIRIKAALASDAAWIAGHQAAVPMANWACLTLLPLSVLAIGLYGFAPLVVTMAEWSLLLVGLGWILAATRAAAQAAQAAEQRSGRGPAQAGTG